MNELQVRELLHLADDIRVSAAPSVEDLRTAGPHDHKRSGNWIMWSSVAAAMLLFVGFIAVRSAVETEHPSQPVIAKPADPDATMRPDLMRARPRNVMPGEYVLLYFPEKTTRGLGFVLEAKVEDSWELRSSMYPSPSVLGSSKPLGTSEPYSPGPAGIYNVAITGEGPDAVAIPPDTAAGEYRICTSDARENFCTPLTISDSPGLRSQPSSSFDCASASASAAAATAEPAPTSPVDDPQSLLICPGDDSAPKLLTAGDRDFDVAVAALSLPDQETSAVISCVRNMFPPPRVLAATSRGFLEVTVPTGVCGAARWEVSDALDDHVPWRQDNLPLDGLALSLNFDEVESGPISVQSGGSIASTLKVANYSKSDVTVPVCSLGSYGFGLIPLDTSDVPTPMQIWADCDGDLQVAAGTQRSRVGPTFRAVTPSGNSLPPGQYLAVMELRDRSERLVYPVVITP